MELNDFAREILLTDSLEVKLTSPGGGVVITDDNRGEPERTPGLPGRPADLRLRADRERAPLPGIHQLESGDEEQRGILLHFFCNHELLATELMALVLLKFPDAPAEFRSGVFETLLEEQRHTRWYLKRMEECGVRFGDLPVSGYFWDAVAPMESPLDYVTRLSLTFEQANLDYARHYAEIFNAVGDAKTGKILHHIYRDEIGHVGYGLKWFRKWKREGESDWDAFQRQLHFPLSPSRAKGNATRFNAEGRLVAGFDEDFVNRLEIFRRSKGRTPNVYWFRPDEEAAMASGLDGKDYRARDEIDMLASDLDILPAFLARPDDVVLVREVPSASHQRRLRDCGFELPEFETLAADGILAGDSLLKDRKLNELRPWGWGPQSARLFAPLMGHLPGSHRDPGDYWNAARRALFSKAWDLELLEQLSGTDGAFTSIPETGGRFCETMEQVDAAVGQAAGRGFEGVMLKAPFGASGQKNRRADAHGFEEDPGRRWSQRILRQQGGLIVEPMLERVLDFSVQYEMETGGLRKLAVIRLENDIRGQFCAAACGPKICQGLEAERARFLMEHAFPLYEEGAAVARALETRLREAGYTGPVGVDAFVYREGRGAAACLRLKPIVEINPRYTMGRLAWELMRRVEPGHWVRFEIAKKRAEVDGDALPAPSRGRAGKMAGGAVVLNDPGRARRVLAVLRVGKRREASHLLSS